MLNFFKVAFIAERQSFDLKKSPISCRIQDWIVNEGPTAALILSLLVKFVYASLSLEQPVQLDRAVFSATAASLLVLIVPLVWMRRPWRFLSVLLMNFFLTTLLLADRIHLRFFGDLLSVAEFTQFWQLGPVASSVFSKMRAVDALYYVDIFVVILIIMPFQFRSLRKQPGQDRLSKILLSGELVFVALLLSIPTVLLAYKDRQEVFEGRAARRQFVGVMGFLPYHLYDITIQIGTLLDRAKVSESQRVRVRLFLNERRQRFTTPSPLFGIARGRNLIMVMAESLQAFPIGLRVAGQSVTPNLDAFSQECFQFVNFCDQTGFGATSDGEFTSLQSLHPLSVGAIATRYLTNQYHGLPAILSENGYATLAAIGQAGEYWNMRGMHERLGFQRSYFDDYFKTGERFGQGLADGDFFPQTLPLLTAQTEPFMAFLTTLSNHHPFDLPRKYRELNLADFEGTLVGNYLHSVHYFDHAFGEFVTRLREAGLLDKSVVVLYGDHQGWLEDPPELARLLGFSHSSQYDFWKVRKKLPFMIRLPHAANAGLKRVAGGHLDISPTLLSLLGIKDRNSVMLGTDLTQEKDSLVVFRDGGFADGKYYLMDPPDLEPSKSCVEIQTGHQIDCQLLDNHRRQAVDELEISDLILQGNLIPALTNPRTDMGKNN